MRFVSVLTLQIRRMMKNLLLISSAVLCALAAAPAAAADDQQSTPQSASVRDIVVTAQTPVATYTAETATSFGFAPMVLAEIPQSLQVLTRDLIDNSGALSLAELFGNVAGASNAIGRSVPFGTATTQVRGQDVSIFRDGLRDVDFSDIDSSALVNVDRVEVLKGPAGLVFGTGGPGGVVNIVTRTPTDKLEGRVSATLGQRATKILAGDISVPIVPGLGVRVSAEIERSDSFIDFSRLAACRT